MTIDREAHPAHEHIETVIIGAGQAGLAVAQQLTERGRPCVVLDANARVGDNWRRHYDSLVLYNPAKLCSLPGLVFPGDPDRYPTRDEVGDYLEDYAATLHLPVRPRTWVRAVRPVGDRYLVSCEEREILADNVVVATGTFGRAYTPAFASELDPSIVQLHSSEYRNPSQLQPGPVLVVGAAHSGADIAMELAGRHTTVLAGRDTGQVPFDLGSRRMRVLWPVLSFVARRVLTLKTPVGRKVHDEIRAHGGPLIRYKTADLVEAGVERVEDRVTGVRDGRPVLGGERLLEAANVVWCTGFRQDFGWIDLPIVGEDGWPREQRGVVTDAPGLYFAGLAFQYSFGSMLLVGVGQDAAYLAKHIDARTPVRERAVARAAA
ncbi:MAG TPA: NAD(P)/FAD-dependent oxidoreductase [Nitriliruptorales bacterium]